MKKIISILIIGALLFTNAITAFAVDEPTLADYQDIADQILNDYNVSEFTNYQLFEIPDMSLEEYAQHIEEFAIMNASALESIQNHSNSNNITDSSSIISPRVIFLRSTYNESKLFTPYFRVYVIYDVVIADGTDDAWIENVHSITGTTTVAGNLLSYKFKQYSAYYLTNDDETITCYVTGNWTVEKGGAITEMGTTTLHATFGEDHL